MTRTFLCVGLALLLTSTSFAQNAVAQDDEDELPSGLLAEYSTLGHTVRRVDPDIAFVWNQAAPDERLAAAPFNAKWSGSILLRGEGKTRFHAFVQGKVEVRIDNKVVVCGEADKPAWLSGGEFDFGFGEKPFAVTFTRTGSAAQLKLYWSSNEFPLEPLPYHILFHEAPAPEIALAARGRVLFEAHRCANCHGEVDGRGLTVEGQTKATSATASTDNQPSTFDHRLPLPAPSLKHVGQGTSRAWLVEKVMGSRTLGEVKAAEKAEEKTPHPNPLPAEPGRGDKAEDKEKGKAEGKMPAFGFTREEAEAVVAALIEQAQPVKLDAPPKLKDSERDKDLKEGRTLIRSVGCLACHTYDTLGEATPFGGGSLTDIGQRRSADWLATWLFNPMQLNEHARMPVVTLSDKERAQIVLALLVSSPTSSGERGAGTEKEKTKNRKEEPLTLALSPQSRGEGTEKEKAKEEKEDPAQVALGRKLIESSRCSACHQLSRPQSLAARPRSLSRGDLDWLKSCTQATNRQPGQPSFSQVDEKAVRTYVATWGPVVQQNEQNGSGKPLLLPLNPQPSILNPSRLLEQKNCLACHDRDDSKGLSRLAASIAKADETLSGLHMTLIPPRLHAVGDRLHDEALKDAIIGGPKSPRLSWLRVRMPRFQHTDEEKTALVAYLIGHDRVPGGVNGGGLRVEGQTKPNDAGPPSGSPPSTLDPQPAAQRLLAGRELLGGKGFSCVACHAVKDYTPKVTALGTRGSNLHLLGQRMRPEYYYRWTRAPLRIMPGVEMPNYQRPHPTILVSAGATDPLRDQLTAIWDALNDPNLTAPTNPAVVEQLLTVNKGERSRIVRDVFTVAGSSDETVARAFAIGFDNGHSALFDLDTGCFRAWSLGDFARQRCEGKRWYWDLAGVVLGSRFDKQPDILFVNSETGEIVSPETGWQFELTLQSHGDLVLYYRLSISKGDVRHEVQVTEVYRTLNEEAETEPSGWERQLSVVVRKGLKLVPWLRAANPETLHPTAQVTYATETKERPAGLPSNSRPILFQSFDSVMLRNQYSLKVRYTSTLRRIEASSPNPPVPPLISSPDHINSVPGFRGERLPLPRSIMPTAMTFDDQSRLIFTSLKGHVYRVDGSGKETGDRRQETGEEKSKTKPPLTLALSPHGRGEGTKPKNEAASVKLTMLTEGLAAPFGVMWYPQVSQLSHMEYPQLLVAHKPELLVLFPDREEDDVFNRRWVLATGWGITDDYHDWTCGIVQDSLGNFFTVTGSDYAFKARPKEKSRWRGDALKISPKGEVTSFARGLRFPTGIAMDDQDRLFVTDQQGVQNTFNELNHVQEGRRYGVPSRHEPEPDAPADPPAVQLPHPWTRSVNGLVFVPRTKESEVRSQKSEGKQRDTDVIASSLALNSQPSTLNRLGGHFLAVEYNNNSIIRMSIQDVGGVTQGAVYPFSRPTSANEAPPSATPNSGGKPQPQDSSSFIGPICIGVSPAGEIYVGGFQDGGWAGGLNMGDIVKLTPEAALPNGLREIRATSHGFDLEFFHSVDAELAGQTSQYKISGYTRVWKGDYATPDSGRHTGEVTDVQLDDAARTVSLTVKGLKPGHVYDVAVGEIGRADQRTLWPAIGHYTLHRIPE